MRPENLSSGAAGVDNAHSAGGVYVLAPTFLEYWAARRQISAPHPIYAGMRLARWQTPLDDDRVQVIVCGLAGALIPDIAPGTVLVPESIGLTDGSTLRCDGALVQALARAARDLGFHPEMGPLLTSPTLVTGPAREHWGARGFVAADMETGLLAGRAHRVATVRVVLDTPQRTLSPEWLRPWRAMLQPSLWGELLWLTRVSGPYAARAAAVANAGLQRLSLSPARQRPQAGAGTHPRSEPDRGFGSASH